MRWGEVAKLPVFALCTGSGPLAQHTSLGTFQARLLEHRKSDTMPHEIAYLDSQAIAYFAPLSCSGYCDYMRPECSAASRAVPVHDWPAPEDEELPTSAHLFKLVPLRHRDDVRYHD